jgi:hypothetical protein
MPFCITGSYSAFPVIRKTKRTCERKAYEEKDKMEKRID